MEWCTKALQFEKKKRKNQKNHTESIHLGSMYIWYVHTWLSHNFRNLFNKLLCLDLSIVIWTLILVLKTKKKNVLLDIFRLKQGFCQSVCVLVYSCSWMLSQLGELLVKFYWANWDWFSNQIQTKLASNRKFVLKIF